MKVTWKLIPRAIKLTSHIIALIVALPIAILSALLIWLYSKIGIDVDIRL